MEQQPNPNKLIDQYNSSLDFQDQETKEANRIIFEGRKMELERIKTYTTLVISSLTAIILAEILSESTIIESYTQCILHIYIFFVICILLLSLSYWKMETYFWFTVGNGRFINGQVSYHAASNNLGGQSKDKSSKGIDLLSSQQKENKKQQDNLIDRTRIISWLFDVSFFIISILFGIMIIMSI